MHLYYICTMLIGKKLYTQSRVFFFIKIDFIQRLQYFVKFSTLQGKINPIKSLRWAIYVCLTCVSRLLCSVALVHVPNGRPWKIMVNNKVPGECQIDQRYINRIKYDINYSDFKDRIILIRTCTRFDASTMKPFKEKINEKLY